VKAIFKTGSGQLAFEITGETTKDVFKQIAAVQEVFDAERACGICKGKDLRFLARQVEDFDFYELACGNPQCRARFAFGQAKKGGALFPKRKNEDGEWLPNGGWSKYEKPGAAQAPGAAKQDRTNGVATFASWPDAEASQHVAELSHGKGEARMGGLPLRNPLLQTVTQLRIGRGAVAFLVGEDGVNIGLELLQELALGSVRKLYLLQFAM
jgi:hypothetical protein